MSSAASDARSKRARPLAENQRFALEATYLTLTANVVTAAIQEASLRGQIGATQDIIKAESDQFGVVRNQFEVGAATRADVLQQESEVATTEASLPPLQKQLEQQHHVLLALIGRFPSETLREHLTLATFHLPTKLPVSLPSQLVQQRPDVRAAQAQLQQASAQIGVAIANRLPQFTITGDVGSAALTAATLFTPATAVWSHWSWRVRSRSFMALRFCTRNARREPALIRPTHNIATP